MLKRVISLILSLVMVLSLMPLNLTASAQELPAEDTSAEETVVPIVGEGIPVEMMESYETDTLPEPEGKTSAVSNDGTMTQVELVSAIQDAYNNGEYQYILTKEVEITSDCTISGDKWERCFPVVIGEGGVLRITEGAVFTVVLVANLEELLFGEFEIHGGEIIVENGAAFNLKMKDGQSAVGGSMSVYEGVINVKTGGTLTVGSAWINNSNVIAENGAIVTGHFNIQADNSFISGVDSNLIEANFDVKSNDAFEKALLDSGKYNSLNISAWDLVISQNITIAENVSVYWDGSITVSAGTTVTNYGTIQTYSGTISIEKTGAIVNHGLVTCAQDGLINDGIISGNDILFVNKNGNLNISTYEQLKMLEDCDGLASTPSVIAPIILTDNVSYGGYARIAEGGELIVPDSVTLTTDGVLIIYGKITVKDGGTLILDHGGENNINLYGTISVESGGICKSKWADGQIYAFVSKGARIPGVPREYVSFDIDDVVVETSQEFKEAMDSDSKCIAVAGDIELDEDNRLIDKIVRILDGSTLTINNRVLFQGEEAKLIVSYGGVLIVNRYDLSFFSNGSLTIEEGGKLYNNHTITIGTAGVANVETGATVVNENARFYIWESGALNIEAGASFDNSKGFIHVSSEGSINDPASILTNNGFIDDGIIDNSGVTASGTCGDSLYWSIANRTLTISGTGRMYDYDGYFDGRNGPLPPWSDYNSIIDFLVIEPGITHIGNMAFEGNFTTVAIPEGVTSIGDSAFWLCYELESVKLPEGVVFIGDYAFSDCYKLKEINLPDSLQTIGEHGFYGCEELKNITIPAGITTIREETFSYCWNLTRIKFTGDAPVFETTPWGGPFNGVTAVAYYPGNNTTWTEEVRQDYGGNIAWVAYKGNTASVNGVSYENLGAAIEAAETGETVQLLQDVSESDVVLPKGIALDLNGHVLEADYIFAVNGANIVDESEGNTGLLKADADCVLISKANAQLPVWNGEGYVFSKVTYRKALVAQNADMVKFAFMPQFQSVATELLKDGAEGNKVTVEVRVSWETIQGREYRNLVFNNDQVALGISSGGAFILTFSGFSQLNLTTDVAIEAVVYSETGVSVASKAIVVDVTGE